MNRNQLLHSLNEKRIAWDLSWRQFEWRIGVPVSIIARLDTNQHIEENDLRVMAEAAN